MLCFYHSWLTCFSGRLQRSWHVREHPCLDRRAVGVGPPQGPIQRLSPSSPSPLLHSLLASIIVKHEKGRLRVALALVLDVLPHSSFARCTSDQLSSNHSHQTRPGSTKQQLLTSQGFLLLTPRKTRTIQPPDYLFCCVLLRLLQVHGLMYLGSQTQTACTC